MKEVKLENFHTLSLEIAEGVARLTLNRPDSANAFDPEICRELRRAVTICDESDDVRAVVLTGAGKMFSAGGDLKYFSTRGEELGAALKEITTDLHAAISGMASMDAPVVCAVNGMAAGAGASLVAACDFAVAARSARFTMAYTAAGLSPDGSSTWFLPRLLGMRRARELLLTNRMLSAEEAMEIGLIDAVAEDSDLLNEANAMAVRFASGPTRAYGVTKRLLRESWTNGLEVQTHHEARAIAAISSGKDAREGVDAFVNKRKPVFTGE